ncbi:hypothetical protein [Novosphingobium album (ex Hu et al. 2023)]|uniref:Uncharacterized protein n=1 Tax=Novosphingobium album (ex Hu et al. 2023) TaxID=2930093 RepID=A0ABT0B5S9_9SPHN|nr:hypothetical protein [Novosphingobium album (ex Hu et al. 2023)]MCJ2180264.1 hypothetical protein [Novosphingobium album (ex Hu et al. 2023)]
MKRILAPALAAFIAAAVAPAAFSPAAAIPSEPSKPKYSTAETPLGDLLDTPATKAILEKYLPELVANDQIEMARGMTLKQLQNYAGDMITEEKLHAIDEAFVKIAGQ